MAEVVQQFVEISTEPETSKVQLPDRHNNFSDNDMVLTLQEIHQDDWNLSSLNSSCDEAISKETPEQHGDHIYSLTGTMPVTVEPVNVTKKQKSVTKEKKSVKKTGKYAKKENDLGPVCKGSRKHLKRNVSSDYVYKLTDAKLLIREQDILQYTQEHEAAENEKTQDAADSDLAQTGETPNVQNNTNKKIYVKKNDLTKAPRKKRRRLAKTKETVYMVRRMMKFFEREKKFDRTYYRQDPEKRLAHALNVGVKTIQHLNEPDKEAVDGVVDSLHQIKKKDKPRKPNPNKKITEEYEVLIKNIVNDHKARNAKITVNQLRDVLKERGVCVARSTLQRTLKSAKIKLQKSQNQNKHEEMKI